MKYDQNSHRYARKDELSPNLLFSNITVGTPLLMNLNNMKLTAICMKKHSSKIHIITLTVEYDIAIHLEFTGEISIRYHLRIFQQLPHQTLD